MPKVFLAYPSGSSTLDYAYDGAIEQVRSRSKKIELLPWTEMSVSGKIIWQSAINSIQKSDVVCADISFLNPNVVYEIGYAIGLQKPIVLLINKSLPDQDGGACRPGMSRW